MTVASWTQLEIAAFTVLAAGLILQFYVPRTRGSQRLVDLLLSTGLAMLGAHFSADVHFSIAVFGVALLLVGATVAVQRAWAWQLKSIREPRSQAAGYSMLAAIVAGVAVDALMHAAHFGSCSAAGGSTLRCALNALA